MIKDQQQGKILGVKVSSISREGVIDFVSNSLKQNYKFFITTPNPEMVVLAQTDKIFLKALNSSDIQLPDGIGLLWESDFSDIGYKLTRIKGRGMFLTLLKLASLRKLKIYLLGSNKEVNLNAVARIKQDYKNIKIKGDSGFNVGNDGKPVSQEDIRLQKDIIGHINMFKPDILFVAFGHPRQEKWVVNNLQKLQVGGAMVIGGTLDYFTGRTVLPPMWMERMGLEWMWRLLREPWRIKRILTAVIVFPILILKEKLSPK